MNFRHLKISARMAIGFGTRFCADAAHASVGQCGGTSVGRDQQSDQARLRLQAMGTGKAFDPRHSMAHNG